MYTTINDLLCWRDQEERGMYPVCILKFLNPFLYVCKIIVDLCRHGYIYIYSYIFDLGQTIFYHSFVNILYI